MKITQITTELAPAGAERIVADLSTGLKKAGLEVNVISLKPLPHNLAIVDQLRNNGIKIDSLNMGKTSFLGIFKLKEILKNEAPDIVHSHLFHANLAARLNSIKRNYKLVNTVHISEKRPGKWWHFFIDKLTSRYCDKITCVSKAVMEFYADKTSTPADKLALVYNGIIQPEKLTTEKVSDLRKEWGVEHCSKVVGSVGRLDWQKGYDIFLKTLTKLSECVPENEKWGVVILGEGKERQKLEQLAAKASGKFKICLPGFRPDAASCAGAFDLFVMPSRYEGFGLTLTEAMAHGMPVLANNIDSLPELIEDYPNGEIIDFSTENTKKVSEKIYHMSASPFTAPYNKFTTDEMVKNYINLYKYL